MNQEELNKILEDHKLWLAGKGGQKANLRNAYLSDAYLSNADLSAADLSAANLSDANLRHANLSDANLSYASIRSANLRNANLIGADLSYANLRKANLSYAKLCYTNLSSANLVGVKVNWQSHELIAEMLLQGAGSVVNFRKIAGLVLVSKDWCWDKFARCLTQDERTWAKSVLGSYIQESDDLPEQLEAHSPHKHPDP